MAATKASCSVPPHSLPLLSRQRAPAGFCGFFVACPPARQPASRGMPDWRDAYSYRGRRAWRWANAAREETDRQTARELTYLDYGALHKQTAHSRRTHARTGTRAPEIANCITGWASSTQQRGLERKGTKGRRFFSASIINGLLVLLFLSLLDHPVGAKGIKATCDRVRAQYSGSRCSTGRTQTFWSNDG